LETYSDEMLRPQDIAKEFIIFGLPSSKPKRFEQSTCYPRKASPPTDLGSQLISAPVGPYSGNFWQEKIVDAAHGPPVNSHVNLLDPNSPRDNNGKVPVQ